MLTAHAHARAWQEATSGLRQVVDKPDTVTIAVDTAAHARQAHDARVRHSKVWQGATAVRRAHAPPREPEGEE